MVTGEEFGFGMMKCRKFGKFETLVLSGHQFYTLWQTKFSSSDSSAKNDVRMTFCSAIFGQIKGFAGSGVKPTALKKGKYVLDRKSVERATKLSSRLFFQFWI